MVSANDIKNVQDTWGKLYDQWDAVHASKFYNKLFKDSEEISEAFVKAGTGSGIAMKRQALVFGAILQEFVENLNDPTALSLKIKGLCATHKTRGITNMELFAFALADLVTYMGTTISFTAAQKTSWTAVNEVILHQMGTYFATVA
uniref:Hemoglobin chain I n=1 Tax=Archivesica tsubasa TaxID=3141483 RepID=Q6AW45_9BIVA|nr:hemoglobin chain I [Calyptogena tsubasa]